MSTPAEGRPEEPAPRAPAPDALEFEERMLEGARRYTRESAARAAGVSTDQAARLWRVMGFPAGSDEDGAVYSDVDVQALRQLYGLVAAGVVDEQFAISLARAVGHSAQRLVSWLMDSIVEQLVEHRRTEESEAPAATVALVSRRLDDLDRLVLYAWRRQLAAAGARALADRDSATSRRWLTVGFADLVSYSRLSQNLEERELARLVSRFDVLATDVVAANHGRVVKTVGDEVFFATSTVERAARIALALAETMRTDPVLPDVRVGLATGSVILRQGDVFGRSVNLASRLTTLADPASVLVDVETAKALGGHPDFRIEPLPMRPVRGLGLVQPAALSRAAPTRLPCAP